MSDNLSPLGTEEQFEQLVNAVLYRFNCPPAETLTDYFMSVLQDAEQATLKAHIDTCPLCLEELAALRQYETATAADTAAPLSKTIKEIVATLVPIGSQSGSGLGAIVAAGVRGTSEGPNYTYLADDMRIMINTTLVRNGEPKVNVMGLVMGPATNQHWDVQVEDDDKKVLVTSVDEVGNFMVENLPTGIYQLRLVSEDITVTIRDIWLSEKQ